MCSGGSGWALPGPDTAGGVHGGKNVLVADGIGSDMGTVVSGVGNDLSSVDSKGLSDKTCEVKPIHKTLHLDFQ